MRERGARSRDRLRQIGERELYGQRERAEGESDRARQENKNQERQSNMKGVGRREGNKENKPRD